MRILWGIFSFLTYKGTSEGLRAVTNGICVVLCSLQDAFIYMTLGSARATLLESSLFHCSQCCHTTYFYRGKTIYLIHVCLQQCFGFNVK